MFTRERLVARLKQLTARSLRLTTSAHPSQGILFKDVKAGQRITATLNAENAGKPNNVKPGIRIVSILAKNALPYPMTRIESTAQNPKRQFHTSAPLRGLFSNVISDPNSSKTLLGLATGIILAATTAWLGYKFSGMGQEDKEMHEAIKKLEFDIEGSWKVTGKLTHHIHVSEVQPLLHLFSSIDPNEIIRLKENMLKIDEQIALNERLLQRLEEAVKTHGQQKNKALSMKRDVLLQTQHLKVLRGFCATFCCRKEKRFSEALIDATNWIVEIKKYEEMLKEANRALDFVKAVCINAYNHKAKIHRSLAGKDLENLDREELKRSQESYETALKIGQNKVILTGLGFLLTDMSAMVVSIAEREAMLNQALEYHQQAKAQDSQDPNIQHGFGYDLYKIEKCHAELSQTVDMHKLQEALDAFSIVQQKNPNARLFHDRGLIHLLMKNEDNALLDFKQGLSLDPQHTLLRYERGVLFLKQGKIEQALEDLKQGRMVSLDSESLKKKYDEAIQLAVAKLKEKEITEGSNTENLLVVSTPKTENVASGTLVATSSPLATSSVTKIDLEELDIRKIAKQGEFEDTLRECAKYARKLNLQAKPPTIFISYAWGIPVHERWVEQFANELEIAGFDVLLDRWNDRKGKDLMGFVNKMGEAETDYIIVVGTPLYLAKYKRRSITTEVREPVVGIEARLVDYLTGYSRMKSEKVIPVVLEGPVEKALPPMLLPKLFSDFWRGDKYSEMLSLVRDMYNISQRDKEFQKIQSEFTAVSKGIDARELKEVAEKYQREQRQMLLAWQSKIDARVNQRVEIIASDNNKSSPLPSVRHS